MLLLIILVLPLVISTSDLNLPHVTFDQNAQKITLKKINILNKQGEDSTFVINKSYELPAFGKFIKINDGKATFLSEFGTKIFKQKEFTQLFANHHEICVTKVSDHTDAYNIGFLHCENGDIMDTENALIQKSGNNSKPQMSGEDGRDQYLKLLSYIPCVDYLPAYNTYTTCQKAHTAFKARKAAKSYIRYRSTWGAYLYAVMFDAHRGGNQPIRFYWNKNADKRSDGLCGIRNQTNDENEAFWKKIFEKVKTHSQCESVCRSIIQGATKTNINVNKMADSSSVSGNAALCDKPIPTEIKKTIKNCPTLTTHGQNQLCYHPKCIQKSKTHKKACEDIKKKGKKQGLVPMEGYFKRSKKKTWQINEVNCKVFLCKKQSMTAFFNEYTNDNHNIYEPYTPTIDYSTIYMIIICLLVAALCFILGICTSAFCMFFYVQWKKWQNKLLEESI